MGSTNEKIIICGLNGAGKSTFGRALAKATGFKFADIEEYYFSPDDITYSSPKSKDEVSKLLYEDIRSSEGFILSAIKGDYGDAVGRSITLAVYLNVPKGIRLTRVLERSERRFGKSISENDDLRRKENEFFRTVEIRNEALVTDWLIRYDIPIIVLDGTMETREMVTDFLSIYEGLKKKESTVYTSLKNVISRVRLMENYFNTLHQELKNDPRLLLKELWASDMLRILSDYYEDGRWLNDYTLDEASLLPPGMRRGVLSQDALYDFLSDVS
ncbi:MAG: DUF4298 domain-containing protein [Clostridia bacterium]|nr:DUF4298 domain-containing protein [Clostridia bacterium]